MERNNMHNLLKIIEKTGGCCEFIPNFFSRDDSNHQNHFTKSLMHQVCSETKSMIQFRVVTHRTVNYLKVHRIFDDDQ